MTLGPAVVVDLGVTEGRGVVQALATDDLNVNVVAWRAGEGVGGHINRDGDVLVVVADGAIMMEIDGVKHDVSAGQLIVIPRGADRRITAGPEGVRYVTAHRRRPPLDVGRSFTP